MDEERFMVTILSGKIISISGHRINPRRYYCHTPKVLFIGVNCAIDSILFARNGNSLLQIGVRQRSNSDVFQNLFLSLVESFCY